jgi:hypothetical protein
VDAAETPGEYTIDGEVHWTQGRVLT